MIRPTNDEEALELFKDKPAIKEMYQELRLEGKTVDEAYGWATYNNTCEPDLEYQYVCEVGPVEGQNNGKQD